MFIAAGEEVGTENGIINYIPTRIRRYLYGISFKELEEIRLGIGQPVVLVFHDEAVYLAERGITRQRQKAVRASKKDLTEALELVCASSVYAHEEQIRRGFVCLKGGHRVGICGNTAIKNGQVSFIKSIGSMNYRVARAAYGAADGIIDNIINQGSIRNTLLISPPGQGKTTLLRDIARALSVRKYRVSVVDERGELAGLIEGSPSFDLGDFCDVMDGCSKASGMEMMIRSMNPSAVITDEIFPEDDENAVKNAVRRGTAVIAAIHGRNYEALRKDEKMKALLSYFSCFITISQREVQEVRVI